MAIYKGDKRGNRINGSNNDDEIYGYEGNDTLKGNSGNDTLVGGTGTDSLDGGNGNDILIGGIDNDSLGGREGVDTYVFSKGDGNDYIYNYDTDLSSDVINFTDIASTDITSIYEVGDSTLVIKYGSTDSIMVYGFFDPINSNLYNLGQFQFTDTTWTLADIAARHNGTSSNDKLYGINGLQNTINGLDGNDIIYAGNENDSLNGGNGIDTVSYEYVANAVNVNLSIQIATGSGTDTIIGFENATGSAFNDILIGDSNNNQLSGGKGDDLLSGGWGDDFLYDGDGNDTYVIAKNEGNDTIYNVRSIFDTSVAILKYIDLSSTEVIGLFQVEDEFGYRSLIIKYQGGQTVIKDFYYEYFDGPTGGGNYQIDKIQFTDTSWDINYIANHIKGSQFSDQLQGLQNMENTINGLAGDDYIFGGNLGDTLNGDSGDDNIHGYDGNDSLNGGAGNDNMDGYEGDDTLNGGSGNNILRGNVGNDTYLIAEAPGIDTIINFDDNNGVDIIKFLGITSAEVIAIYESNAGNLVIQFGSGDQITVQAFFSIYPSYLIDKIQFTDTTWTLADIASRHNGTSNNDTLLGFNGISNTINGLDGDDTIQGGDGNDSLNGGNGIDTVDYQKAVNGIKVNLLTGQATGVGTDTLTGFEKIKGSQYDDILIGNNDNNVLYGFANNDLLSGLDGDDMLYGDVGNDILKGGKGNDTLIGGEGDDVLNGGKGSDTVDYRHILNGINRVELTNLIFKNTPKLTYL